MFSERRRHLLDLVTGVFRWDCSADGEPAGRIAEIAEIIQGARMVSFSIPALAGNCHRQLRSLRVIQGIFELGKNRPNGVNALSQSLQLPLLGVEAAERSEAVLGSTPRQAASGAVERGRKIMQIGMLLVRE